MGVVAKKSSVLVLGYFTSTATLNFNYQNVFQALYSITRFLRQTHDAWFSAGRFLLCRGSRWEKNKGSGKCAVNDGKREKALFLSIVAPYDTERPLRRREYWALVKLNFSKDVKGINFLFDEIKSHGKRVILLFFFCFIFSVHWKQMTTSPVCFGASADSFGHFVTPIAGDLLTFKLIHQSGSVQCTANPLYASHWGCTPPTLPQDHQLGTIITNSQSERLLPKDDFFLEGIDCNNTFYGLPGQTANSPELLFDHFSTPLHVSVGQEFQIWFGEDLNKCWHEDNGLGKTCVLVLGLFV